MTLMDELIRKFDSVLKFLAGICLSFLVYAPAAFAFQVTSITYSGLSRTNQEWLETFLHLQPPQELSDSDLATLTQKLLNTGVFYDIRLNFVPTSPDSESGALNISFVEKWTLLPVLRGAIGGGTPLLVLGAYDTHAFGSFWTVGAELRKYGDAPLSYLIWANAPRWLRGEHLLSLKFWQNNRDRELLDEKFNEKASIRSKTRQAQLSFYFPKDVFNIRVQTGFDLSYFASDANRVTLKDPQHEFGFNATTQKQDEIRPLFNVIYDDIRSDFLTLDGLRVVLKAGVLSNDDGMHSHYESEGFYFKLFENDWNFAAHWHTYTNTGDHFQDLIFLGGLESIRGLPEGVLYGNRAYYANFELRKILTKQRYSWLQANVFVDGGNAGWHWADIGDEQIISAGVGLKIAIPQVNRLVLRFDYAWGLTDPSFQGVSFGFNSFFQPYRPN